MIQMESRSGGSVKVQQARRSREASEFPALMFEDPEHGEVIGAVTVDGIADPDPGTRYSGPVQVFELEVGGERLLSSEGLDLLQRLAAVTTGSSESMRWAAAQSAVWTLFEVADDPTRGVDAHSDPFLIALAVELELMAVELQAAPPAAAPSVWVLYPDAIDQPRLLALGAVPISATVRRRGRRAA